MSLTSDRGSFYKRELITATSFSPKPTFKFGFTAQHLILVNDSNDNISFSYNGEDLDGEVLKRDHALTIAWKSMGQIWLITDGTSSQIRIWAWIE